MSRKGFVAAIVIFVVLALAVIGSIAWVHYYYLPHMAAENANTAQAAPTSSVTSIVPAPATSTASTSSAPTATSITKVENNTGLISCASNDLSCLIAAARTCSPASVEWSSTLNLFGALIQTTKSNLALKGVASGKCSFVDRTDGVSLAFPSTTIAQAEAKGITAAQIQEQLQQSSAQAQQSVGITTKCTFTTSYLTQMLKNWSEGSLSSNDFNSGNCTATTASGTPIQIYTGGTIPLLPNNESSSSQNTQNNTPAPSAPPSGVETTVGLFSGTDTTWNGFEYKVNTLTASEVNVTITDTATGQSQTVPFTVNNPVTVFGHAMTVTSISQISGGTVNGQPAPPIEQATLTYN